MNFITSLSTREISKHLHPRGKNGIYWLDITTHNKRIRATMETIDKRDALARAVRMLASMDDKSRPRMTLTVFRDQYLEYSGSIHSESRTKFIARCFDRFISCVGDMELTKLTRSHIDEFDQKLSLEPTQHKQGRNIKLKGLTINGIVDALHAAFSYAIERDLIESDLFANFRRHEVEVHAANVYTPVLMRQIVDKALSLGNDFDKVIELYLYTGMRKEEGLKIDFKDIDFDSGILVIPARITKKKRDRVVPLNRRAMEIICYMKEKHGKLVPFTYRQMRTHFEHIRDKLKFRGNFHDVRKTTNSWLKLYARLNDSYCEMVLGHVNTRNMNNMFYTALLPDEVRKAMEVLATTLRPEAAGETTASKEVEETTADPGATLHPEKASPELANQKSELVNQL